MQPYSCTCPCCAGDRPADDPPRYVLVRDEDSHWYVCPADREADADAYFEAVADYWRGEFTGAAEPDEPDWLVAVGGSPSRVTFTGFTID